MDNRNSGHGRKVTGLNLGNAGYCWGLSNTNKMQIKKTGKHN